VLVCRRRIILSQLGGTDPVAILSFVLLGLRGLAVAGAGKFGSFALSGVCNELRLGIEVPPASVAMILVCVWAGWCWHAFTTATY
jgi:hypothetical protein